LIFGSLGMPVRNDHGRRAALIIASSDYHDPALQQLRAPGHDAVDLAEVLGDPEIGMFDVQTLMDVPSDQLLRGIAQFYGQADPGDLLLIYLSCHGVLDDRGRLYYATTNTERSLLSATAVSAQWLSEQMDDCRARQKILVLDCCHSGAFARGSKGDSALALGGRFGGRGKIVLTASGSTEYSFEETNVVGEGVRSVFTRAVVDGLRTGEADRDKDGLVTVNELYHHIYETVRAAEPRQTPKLWVFGTEGDLLIARSPRGAIVEPTPLPEDLRLTLENPRLVVRESGVKVLAELLDHGGPGIALTARQTLQRIREEDHPRIAALAKAAQDADRGHAVTQVEAQEQAERAAAQRRREMERLQQKVREEPNYHDADTAVAADDESAAREPSDADPSALTSITREQSTDQQQAKSAPAEADDQLTEADEPLRDINGEQELIVPGRLVAAPEGDLSQAPVGVDQLVTPQAGEDQHPQLADEPESDPDEKPKPLVGLRIGDRFIPRRILITISLGVVTVVIIIGGWLGYNHTQQQYFVGLDKGQVAIFRGVNQRVAGISLSSVYARSGISEQQVPPQERSMVAGTVTATSLSDAQHIVDQLQSQDTVCKQAYASYKDWIEYSRSGPEPTMPSDCPQAADLGVASLSPSASSSPSS
jgi:hypothetical protein